MFSKEVKDNLSKYKYIYKTYREDNNFHIEHYPIIYSNSEYIYYKSARKNTLNYIKVNELWWNDAKIFETIEKAIEYINNRKETWHYPLVYFISEKIKNYDLKQIKINLKEESNKNKIKEKENRVKRAKEEYERALKELENIKSQN